MLKFLSLPFLPVCMVPGPLSCSSTCYWAVTKIIYFILHLLLKFWVQPFPLILNITWKITFLIQPPCCFFFAFISPRNSLSHSFHFEPGNSCYVAFSKLKNASLSVLAASSAYLIIFQVLYFEVFPSLFIHFLFFFTSVCEKKDIAPLFLVSETSSTVHAFKLYLMSCPLSW